MGRKGNWIFPGIYSGVFPGPFGGMPGWSVLDKDGSKFNYMAYQLARTQQIFEWKGLPESIPHQMLEKLLQINGYCGIAKAPDGKLYALCGGLGGEPDPYYRPTKFTVANPGLDWSTILTIDEDCIIARNDDYYMGFTPMFARYAELLAENDVTFWVNDILARVQDFITAGTDRSKAAADKYLKDVVDGKLGAIADESFLEGIQSHSRTGQLRVIDFVEYAQYLRAMWYNEIGINANYNMKREKLNDGEVNMTNTALLPLVDNMLSCRKEAAEKVNAMFGTQISVEFAGVWEAMKEVAEEKPEEHPAEEQEVSEGVDDESQETA